MVVKRDTEMEHGIVNVGESVSDNVSNNALDIDI